MRTRILTAALLVFACGRARAPALGVTAESEEGLVEIELRGGGEQDRALPGEIVDDAAVEDPEWGEPLTAERDVVLRVPREREAELLASLRDRPDVIWAEPVTHVEALWTPDDPDFAKQWHLREAGAPGAWDTTRGAGVTVAVLDTGIYPVDDLDAARIVPGFNFVSNGTDARDDHGHGTHVAGTIAQSTGNGKGVAGMAPLAKLMPVKVLSAMGAGTSHGIAKGIRWAVDHGAKVLNLSLGGGARSLAMEAAIAYARRKGAVVVCAAGNSGSRGVSYPAAYDGAFAVAALGPSRLPAPYTSYGPEVDLAAPGGDKSLGEERGVLQQTLAEGSTTEAAYRWFQGTSMATPHVSGAAALVISLGVTNPSAVERVLQESAREGGDREHYGAGQLDAAAAVRRVAVWWGLLRLALAALGAVFAIRQARHLGQLRGPGPAVGFWPGLFLGAGAPSIVAPLFAGGAGPLSVLALAPYAMGQRFAGLAGTSLAATALAFVLASPLVPVLFASLARVSRDPVRSMGGSLAAGFAFGWAGALLHAALWRTTFLPWIPSAAVPVLLGISAVVAWAAGRGLFAREAIS